MSKSNKNNHPEGYGKFDFVGKVGFFGGVSLFLTIASLIYLSVFGINYGIDFRGGTEMQVQFSSSVDINEVRKTVDSLNLGEAGVQEIGDSNEYIIRFQGSKGKTDKETNELLNQSINDLRATINSEFSAQSPDFRRVDTVGPQVGAELKRNGLLALFYCLLIILIYVAFRFDYNFSPGAVICLFHDVVITLAIYGLTGKEVNIPILAALLTLIGLSLNDTIVVFDRIRETMHKYKREGMAYIINRAINDMVGRTIITAGTVIISAVCLYIFTEGVVSDIAFTIFIGVTFGIYSSVYVAAPLILFVDKLRSKSAA